MKKLGIITLIVITAIASATVASAATKLTLIVNGQVSKSETKIIGGVTYVPLRAVAELLEAKVDYDAATKTITITGKEAQSVKSVTNAKSFDVDVTIESGPMVMKISKVTLNPAYKYDTFYSPVNAVVIEMTVENTSNKSIIWYPGGEIVTNTKEQIRGYTYDSISGEYKGKVIKKGSYFYEVKGDVTAIRSLNLFVDAAYESNTYDNLSDEKSTEIILE
jgi:hypothetical protein